MLKSSTLIVFTLLIFPLFGQNALQEKLVKACVIQLMSDDGIIIGTGTGCIYQDTIATYLITARHNLYEEEKTKTGTKFHRKTNSCRLLSYPVDVTESAANTFAVNLQTLEIDDLIKFDRSNDIAVIQLGKNTLVDESLMLVNYNLHVMKLTKSSRFYGFGKIETERIDEIELGDDIFIIGFPNAIGLKNHPQYDWERPLVRKGVVAGKSKRFRTFIVDGHVYGGNSGGPVLKYTKNQRVEDIGNGRFVFIREEKASLIGIVSQFIPFQEVWENKNYHLINVEWDNSGYSVIVPIEYGLMLVEEFYK